jgi:hypothetical protein
VTTPLRSCLEEAKINSKVIDAFETNTHQVAPTEKVQLEALVARTDQHGSIRKVTSVRFRNLLINWQETVIAAFELMEAAVHHENLALCALDLLRGLLSLTGAVSIPLTSSEAKLVVILWHDRATENPVSTADVQGASGFAAATFETHLEALIDLGIVTRANGSIRKVDRIWLVA